ncbi:conserved hypothetical protein [Neospora caninum Liverpool]|uniref:Protein DA1-like domain-containing protein n=1 Tax=Neospora caninum (strain Liverpool) TaxID=572307 RepID=F0VIF0_NEOCL|nr:conserved hypothetical protein [Neospora caninum Liverpool]CBZ53511.1 conserved hypothetical protein [Neospora caninum Liverpool]|eukprot:XP_003883543.1 conserved hypothetical protein [Neospora caninum Liverpool]
MCWSSTLVRAAFLSFSPDFHSAGTSKVSTRRPRSFILPPLLQDSGSMASPWGLNFAPWTLRPEAEAHRTGVKPDGRVSPLTQRFAQQSSKVGYHRETSSFVMGPPSVRAVAQNVPGSIPVAHSEADCRQKTRAWANDAEEADSKFAGNWAIPVARSLEALPQDSDLLGSRPATPSLTRTASLPVQSSDGTARRRLIPGFTVPMQTGIRLWCTYCGARLRSHKHLVQMWPEFIMCTPCAAGPSCSTCHRKAFDAVVDLKNGTKSYLCPHRSEEGGMHLCGHCALLCPVRSRRSLARSTATALAWLQSHGVHFTDDLLKYQRTEDVEHLLERLDTQEALQAHVNCPAGSSPPPKPGSAAGNRVFIRSHESLPGTLSIEQGRPCEAFAGGATRTHTPTLQSQRSFTIAVEAVTFAELNPTPATNIYGRCETEKLPVRPGTHGSSSVPERLVRRVGVVRGLPQTFFLSHLTHELLHAFIWCRQPGEGSLRLDVEEGMCNWVSSAIFKDRLEAIDAREADLLAGETAAGVPSPLDSPVFSDIQRDSPAAVELEKLFLNFERRVINGRLGDMESDTHVCYGDGYRAMREVIAAIGLAKTVELTETYGDNLDNFVAAARRMKGTERDGLRATAREAV